MVTAVISDCRIKRWCAGFPALCWGLLLIAPIAVVQAQSPGTSDQDLDRQYAELAQAADNIEAYSKVLKKVV